MKKRVLSLAMALILCLSLTGPAFAVEEGFWDDATEVANYQQFAAALEDEGVEKLAITGNVVIPKNVKLETDKPIQVNIGGRLKLESGAVLNCDAPNMGEFWFEDSMNTWLHVSEMCEAFLLWKHEEGDNIYYTRNIYGTQPADMLGATLDDPTYLETAVFSGGDVTLDLEKWGDWEPSDAPYHIDCLMVFGHDFTLGRNTRLVVQNFHVDGDLYISEGAGMTVGYGTVGGHVISNSEDQIPEDIKSAPKTPTVTTKYDKTERKTFATLTSEGDPQIYYTFSKLADEIWDLDNYDEYTAPLPITEAGPLHAYAEKDGVRSGLLETYVEPLKPSSGGGSGGGSDDSGSGSADRDTSGTVTTTVKDEATGTTTTTTTQKNGTKTVVVTQKNGDKTTTVTQKNGTKTTLTENVGEPVKATVSVGSVTSSGQRVTVPVTVDTDGAEVAFTGVTKPIKAAIPVKGVSSGTVAVIDGVICKTAFPEGGSLVVPLDGNATVVIQDNTKTFSDIPGTFWASSQVSFVTSRELFNGTGNGAFTPNAAMSRQMLMTVLARLDGADTTASPYAQGMAWAKAQGISDGTNPEANITREQLTVMLYRYAGSPAAGGTLDGFFSDAGTVGGYARTAMEWAVQNGIVTGKTGGVLDPKGQATRAEVAVMLQRYIVSVA